MEKLEIMIKLASDRNIDQVHNFLSYVLIYCCGYDVDLSGTIFSATALCYYIPVSYITELQRL